jgi:hypothetical protein
MRGEDLERAVDIGHALHRAQLGEAKEQASFRRHVAKLSTAKVA